MFPESAPGDPPLSDDNVEWGFMRLRDGELETAYCFHPTDLRQLPSSTVDLRGLRRDIPTLIISECCLCYMDVNSSRDAVNWFGTKIESLGIIIYEPIGPDDSFGQMMIANLAARNIVMPSFKTYKTLEDQKDRLADLGFRSETNSSGQEAETIENIWDQWVSAHEKERVDRIDRLDEIEEWQMLARHYAVAWGWRGATGWESWARLRDQK